MVNIIEIKTSIEDSISCFSDVLDKLDSVETLMTSIDSDLGSEKWEGESHEKCVQIQETIKKYYLEIRNLCTGLQNNVQQLKSDADCFSDNSSNVKLIKSI